MTALQQPWEEGTHFPDVETEAGHFHKAAVQWNLDMDPYVWVQRHAHSLQGGENVGGVGTSWLLGPGGK
jgi:hypothetical protein